MRKPLKKTEKKITSFGYPLSVSRRHALRFGKAVTVVMSLEKTMDAHRLCHIEHKSIEGM